MKQGRRQGVQGTAGKSSGNNIEKTERNERDGATERRNASQLYEMRQAEETQIPEFIQVIQERIDWMESRGMKQWNDEEYLDFYSEEYSAFRPGMDICFSL